LSLRFSVATPTRNDLVKLKRCVGSVRGQQGVAVEHWVQDALSSDGTAAWLAGQAGLRFVSEADHGMYDAINRAWAHSSGDVLSWLNADEQYLPGALAAVAAFFAQHDDVDVVFGNYIVCNPSGQAIALRREIPFRPIYVNNGFLNAQSCTLFFRRRLFDTGQLVFDAGLRYAADHDLLMRLSAAGAKIVHLPIYIALFGIDGSNLSTHPQAQSETETLRQRYGGFAHPALRRTVRAGRALERLLRGGYRRESLSYRFARDEVPTYANFQAQGVGGRYALSDLEPR
jgi:glycosyltransferase involved in cell wall biosynthesis